MAKTSNLSVRKNVCCIVALTPFVSKREGTPNGMTAPIAKRKNGKTKSTHVKPAKLGLKSWVGGGSWAWYIHTGNAPSKGIMPEKVIIMTARPLSISMELALFCMDFCFLVTTQAATNYTNYTNKFCLISII